MESQTKENRRDLRLELADRLIQQIESGTAPWQRDWEAGEVQPPVNAITGKPYRGVNYQNLMVFSPDPSDNRWATYKQAKAQGWQVRKGEHGIPIEKWAEYEHKLTESEKEEMRAAGRAEIPDVEKRFGVKHYSVFHASQIEGIPPIERPERNHELEGKPDPRLDGLAEAMAVEVKHGPGGRAFYRASEDVVRMPDVEDFYTAKGHDTTFLHELSHATGHECRLNRDLANSFGSEKYALEELRAEMSAAMTAAALGIGFEASAQNQEEGREAGNSAAYLSSWLGALPEKDRKQILMQTIKDAQGISDYLLERTPEIDIAAPEKAKGKEAEVKAPEQEKPQQDLQASLGSLKGAEITLPNGKVIDAYEYLDQGLKRGYDIQVAPGKDGEIRWMNGEKVGGLVPEALTPVLRSAQPEAGKSLGDTLRAEMVKMQLPEVSKQKKAASLELA